MFKGDTMTNCYVTKQQAKTLIQRLKSFEASLYNVFDSYGYDLNENLGRKNALLSQAQEKELGKILRKEYGGDDVIVDGRPGQPDIVIKSLDRELECKLTSGSGKKYKSFSLQTDYETLKKKGKLDFLFVLTNPAFSKFCVLFFEGLTIDDYFPPANGSRGKSRMKKSSAMKKANVLWGSSININKKYVKKWNSRLEDIIAEKTITLGRLQYELKNAPQGAYNEQNKIADELLKQGEKYEKYVEAIAEKIEYWENEAPKYSFVMEEVED
jgi:hypothetical protein